MAKIINLVPNLNQQIKLFYKDYPALNFFLPKTAMAGNVTGQYNRNLIKTIFHILLFKSNKNDKEVMNYEIYSKNKK